MEIKKDWAGIPASQYPVLKDLRKTKIQWRKHNYCESIYYDSNIDIYLHKDPLHGEVEVYDRKGKHIGVLLPTGEKHPTKTLDAKKSIKAFL